MGVVEDASSGFGCCDPWTQAKFPVISLLLTVTQ